MSTLPRHFPKTSDSPAMPASALLTKYRNELLHRYLDEHRVDVLRRLVRQSSPSAISHVTSTSESLTLLHPTPQTLLNPTKNDVFDYEEKEKGCDVGNKSVIDAIQTMSNIPSKLICWPKFYPETHFERNKKCQLRSSRNKCGSFDEKLSEPKYYGSLSASKSITAKNHLVEDPDNRLIRVMEGKMKQHRCGRVTKRWRHRYWWKEYESMLQDSSDTV